MSPPLSSTSPSLDTGTYEVLRNRLRAHAEDLTARLAKLNAARQEAFGSIETKLVASRRITTANNCVPRDLVALGDRFLFGYNVQFGLKSSVNVEDVFSVYTMREDDLAEEDLALIEDERFREHFRDLYKYYKSTAFAKFFTLGAHLYMGFQVGKTVEDIKTFKWLVKDGGLAYLDNRSDHEYRFPDQHEFEWKRTHRDMHQHGRHPHVSIEDRVFVETVGGDLTIKIENNTESGEGILAELVDHKDQTLDDGEFLYAIVEPLILLKIRPYQEDAFRYFVYNDKLKTAQRLDAIANSCVRLPDSHGLIFANGYCLHTGEIKTFDHAVAGMLFERRVVAPNGEDYLYVFYNRESGVYILLSYNIISQKVETPILCHGFSIFPDGRMLLLKAEREPQKHHVAQLWQTPYVSDTFAPPVQGESAITRIGNKDIVRAMAECHEVLKLIAKEDPYELLYTDLAKRANDLIDSYFWIGEERTFNLKETLLLVKEAAQAAVAEFDKVTKQKRHARDLVGKTSAKSEQELAKAARREYVSVDAFVESLSELRALRGEIVGLRDVRYADLERIDALEKMVTAEAESLSLRTVEFLLEDTALAPYIARIEEDSTRIDSLAKATEAREMEADIAETARQLDLLIDIVSNLKIDDATKTSRIIEGISAVYSRLNQVRAALKNKKKSLMGAEGVAEFGAQVKLLNQSVINYLDISDTPDKCDEYLNKLLVQIEGLEGRFADFDEFVLQLAEKREEVQNAFESKKLALLEDRNRKALAQLSAANRILKGIRNRAEGLKSVEEIHGYFATDLMIEKVRSIVDLLVELGDSVKADEIATRLKTIREDAVRQLKDRQDLFVDGQDVIKFGRHRFSVNTQDLDLTIVARDGEMYIHISGTNFFDRIVDPVFLETRPVWSQETVSETADVYRAEYLAYRLLNDAGSGEVPSVVELQEKAPDELLPIVQKYMAPRYRENYVKGVHDGDAARIMSGLLGILGSIGLLKYRSSARTMAMLWWSRFVPAEERRPIERRLAGLGAAMRAYEGRDSNTRHVGDFTGRLNQWAEEYQLFDASLSGDAARYLFAHLTSGSVYTVHPSAKALALAFEEYLGKRLLRSEFEKSIDIEEDPAGRFEIARNWLAGFATESDAPYVDEAAFILLSEEREVELLDATTTLPLESMLGSHACIVDGVYTLDVPEFLHRLGEYQHTVVPAFDKFQALKKEYLETAREELRTEEFKPRVLTSFVRNRMIDTVYLPLIGDNLAKQIGTVGDTKRTDRMGMLLLVSPPGYGKTTLMEYIANRLGLIFMKINGPTIGHEVTAIDPDNAPSSAAREELEKLNLAFEMGDNVMIYLDDIQHLNPEFLQKFISLCDGQRKIDGVFRGRSRTYDLRGKKVCVVMAGNPYTESGQKFKIPDMLSNRADTYNLGDIIGESREAFELSYIENALTSNAALNPLSTRSQKDVYTFVKLADTGNREGLEFEGNYSAEETNDIVSVLGKLRRIQRTILAVNQQYIKSAGQADEYRTEPPFKLQGSYRNMNRLAEKVVPVMNDTELDELVRSHYEGESQTLTADAEANLLKFKELTGWLTEKDAARWEEIKEGFRRNNRFKGVGADDQMGRVLVQLGDFGKNFTEIRDALSGGLGAVAGEMGKPREPIKFPEPPAPLPEQIKTELTAETMRRLETIFNQLRFTMAASRPVIVTSRVEPAPQAVDASGELPPTDFGTLKSWLVEEEYDIEERMTGVMSIQRESEISILLRGGDDRLHFQADAGKIPSALARHIYRELLVLNTQILPVSVGIDKPGPDDHRLVVLESRDLSNLGKLEFLGVIRTFQSGVEAAKALLAGLLAQAGEEES